MREASIELGSNEEQLLDNSPVEATETNYITNYTPTDAYTAVNPALPPLMEPRLILKASWE